MVKNKATTAQQAVWQNTGRRKPCFIFRFIAHLYIQLDIINLAVEYIINFLSLLSGGQPGLTEHRISLLRQALAVSGHALATLLTSKVDIEKRLYFS